LAWGSESADKRGVLELFKLIKWMFLDLLRSRSSLEAPEGPKTCAVPAEDSFGLNDRECIENAWCDPIEQHEDQPIAYVERSLFRCAST
jgi:hypothetical protein